MFKIGRQIAGIALGVGLLGAGTTAQASVPQDALVVGGIEYGASENYVRSVYGAPHKLRQNIIPSIRADRQSNGSMAAALTLPL